MAEKISVQIALEGGKEVEAQLADIGATGEKSFDQINTAGEQASQGIAKTGEAADKASESMSKLSLETVKTSVEIAKYAAEVAKIGVEIGLLVTRHESLVVSLIKTGLHVRSAVTALELMVTTLNPVTIAVGVTVLAIGGLAIAVEAAAKAAEGIAAPYQKLSQNLETLSVNTGKTFDSLQQGKAAFAELGISGENFAGIITKISEAMATFNVGAKFKEQKDAALQALKELLQAQLKLQELGGEAAPPFAARRLLEIIRQQQAGSTDLIKAEEAVRAAREKSATLAANSLQTLLPLIKQVIEGQQKIKFDELTTAAGKIDAVTAAMKQAEEAGKPAAQTLNEFIANADRLSAIQVGAKFGLTEEQVDNIRLLKESVTEIWDRAKRQPPLFTPEARAAMAEMRKETAKLRQEQVRLQQAWDSSIFARFGASIVATINRLKRATVSWLADFLETGNTFPERFAAWFSTLPAAVDQAIAQAGAAWDWIVQKVTEAKDAVLDFAAALPGIAWDWIISTGGAAWDWIVRKVAAAKQAVVDFSAALPGIAWDWIISTGGAAWDWIVRKIAEAKAAVVDFSAALPGVAWEAFKAAGVAAWDAIIAKVKEFLGLAPKAAPAGGAPAAASGGQFAGGGLLGGRGTGTSDSNLAWVSRGEHIMPARAVVQPGVLAFLEALRRSGGNLSRVLDGMGRFALGGMIRGPMPAFAAGGLAGGMSNVTIQFPGLPAIGGLRASSDVVEQLHRAAALAQVRSGGRKPSRYS